MLKHPKQYIGHTVLILILYPLSHLTFLYLYYYCYHHSLKCSRNISERLSDLPKFIQLSTEVMNATYFCPTLKLMLPIYCSIAPPSVYSYRLFVCIFIFSFHTPVYTLLAKYWEKMLIILSCFNIWEKIVAKQILKLYRTGFVFLISLCPLARYLTSNIVFSGNDNIYFIDFAK